MILHWIYRIILGYLLFILLFHIYEKAKGWTWITGFMVAIPFLLRILGVK
ncbi:MAG: hypothetical protein PWP09_158 [Thermotogota bacterium]|nr:hypothetical protein [Thermotogota bacterium]